MEQAWLCEYQPKYYNMWVFHINHFILHIMARFNLRLQDEARCH